MASLLPLAGDYELQVALVECLFRTTTAAERVPLAQQWFSSQDVIKCFQAIREADFEQVNIYELIVTSYPIPL